MTNLEICWAALRDQLYRQGVEDARSLRAEAADLSGTEIIAREQSVPLFEEGKDYSAWPVGAPVAEEVDGEVQVYKIITPANMAHYPGVRPSNTPSMFSVTHTTDPAKAKQFVPPNGTSGLYAAGECCVENGAVYRNLHEGNEFPPSAMAERWEPVEQAESEV